MGNDNEPFFITSTYSRILAREMHLQERDLPRLLRGTGLPPGVLLPGDETRLSGVQQLQVIQNARGINSAPDLGLQMGRQLQPSTHGPIGYLALSSPDLMTALESLRDFLPLRIAIAQLHLEPKGPWLSCRLQISIDAPADDKRMLLECFALLLQALMESIIGRQLTEGRFEFEFEPPDYAALYPQYLHSPVKFSQPCSALVIPATLARTANTAGDAHTHSLARDLCQNLLQYVPSASLSMTDRVKRLLLSIPLGEASEEQIARALFVSKRTLARRLEAEGSGYRHIRELLLAELAERHLKDSTLSVEAVAAALGYHDAANFRRAFRRWYGMNPSAFRRALATPE
jgi:AraC-like DNA-binding protein